MLQLTNQIQVLESPVMISVIRFPSLFSRPISLQAVRGEKSWCLLDFSAHSDAGLELMWGSASNPGLWMALRGFRALWVMSCVTLHTRRGDVASAEAIVKLNWTLGGLSIATGRWHKPSRMGKLDRFKEKGTRLDRQTGREMCVHVSACGGPKRNCRVWFHHLVSIHPRLPQGMWHWCHSPNHHHTYKHTHAYTYTRTDISIVCKWVTLEWN